MIEAAALNEIKSLVLAASGKQIDGTLMPLILIPKDVGLQNLESYGAKRLRFRGQLDTTSLKDFAGHVVARNVTGAQGFVSAKDTQSLGCTVLFNIGTDDNPGHCDDVAKLSLESTAAFDAVIDVTSRKFEQKEMAEWLEDWSSNLLAKGADGEYLILSRAVSAVRKVTIEAMANSTHQVGDMSASRSAMDSIAASSTEILPTTLEFTAEPYEGLSARSFVLRVGILTGTGKPVFSLRWVQKGAQLEEIAKEFKEILNKEIGGFANLVMGSFNPGK